MIVKLPRCGPVDFGLYNTELVHVCPGASAPRQAPAWRKSPLVEMFCTTSGASVGFKMATSCGGLVVPTTCSPNESCSGVAVLVGGEVGVAGEGVLVDVAIADGVPAGLVGVTVDVFGVAVEDVGGAVRV